MAKELMQCHYHEQRWLVPFQMNVQLFERAILKGFNSWFPIGIAKIDILESKMLSDVIIIGDIDADRDP